MGYARRFAEYFGRSPCVPGAAEIRASLLGLVERAVRPRTFHVYVAALTLLYRVTLERPERVAAILAHAAEGAPVPAVSRPGSAP